MSYQSDYDRDPYGGNTYRQDLGVGGAGGYLYERPTDKEGMERWAYQMSRYFINRADAIVCARRVISTLSIEMYLQCDKASKPAERRSRTMFDAAPSVAAWGDGVDCDVPETIGQPAAVQNQDPNVVIYEQVNAIFPAIRQLVGERSGKQAAFTVRVVNPDAKARADKFAADLHLDRYLRRSMPDLPQMPGGFELSASLPNSDAMVGEEYENDIEVYKANGYRDAFAVKAERLLNEWMATFAWDDWYSETYRTFKLTDTAIGAPRINEDTWTVELEYVDPREVVFDVDSKNDIFSNQTYFYWYEYITVEQALMRYPDVKKEDVLRFINAGPTMFSGVSGWRRQGSTTLILVTRGFYKFAEVKKMKRMSVGEVELEIDGETWTERGETEEKEASYRFEELYEVHLLGDFYVVKAARAKNQLRSATKPGYAILPVEVCVMDYGLSPTSPTLPLRISTLQQARNLCVGKVTEMIGSMKGTIILVDISALSIGDGQTAVRDKLQTLMSNIASKKVILMNKAELGVAIASGAYGTTAEAPVSTITIGMPSEISVVFQQIAFFTEQIMLLLSMNAARTGHTGQYETASVAAQNKQASDFGTMDPEIRFDGFVARLFTKIVNMLKICDHQKRKIQRAKLANPTDPTLQDLLLGFEGEITDDEDPTGVDGEDWLFQDLGAKVEFNPSMSEMKNTVFKVAEMALQQGKIEFDDYAAVLSVSNPAEARRLLDKRRNAKDARARKEAERQEQAQRETMQMQIAMQNQGAQGLQDSRNANAQQLQGMQNQFAGQAQTQQLQAGMEKQAMGAQADADGEILKALLTPPAPTR